MISGEVVLMPTTCTGARLPEMVYLPGADFINTYRPTHNKVAQSEVVVMSDSTSKSEMDDTQFAISLAVKRVAGSMKEPLTFNVQTKPCKKVIAMSKLTKTMQIVPQSYKTKTITDMDDVFHVCAISNGFVGVYERTLKSPTHGGATKGNFILIPRPPDIISCIGRGANPNLSVKHVKVEVKVAPATSTKKDACLGSAVYIVSVPVLVPSKSIDIQDELILGLPDKDPNSNAPAPAVLKTDVERRGLMQIA